MEEQSHGYNYEFASSFPPHKFKSTKANSSNLIQELPRSSVPLLKVNSAANKSKVLMDF